LTPPPQRRSGGSLRDGGLDGGGSLRRGGPDGGGSLRRGGLDGGGSLRRGGLDGGASLRRGGLDGGGSLRRRLALTVLATGLASAIGVLVTVALALQRFEHESTWQRADAFVARIASMHPELLELHRRNPEELTAFLGNLVLYDPESRLYLLDGTGTVLVSTGERVLPAGFRVALEPVREAAAKAAAGERASYVMGDDPERMSTDAVVAARVLSRAVIKPDAVPAGYLYVVCSKPALPPGRLQLLSTSVASAALLPVLAVLLLASGIAAWIIVTVTRPLRVLSDEVAQAERTGFAANAVSATNDTAQTPGTDRDDEIGRLRSAFRMLLATLRRQWDELQRLDRFRRESVSNLSHDLRSPLTATVACLETLEQRGLPAADAQLVQVALRNTRNAAGMVRALGDLAMLDEPAFQLHPMRIDLAEVLDDIQLRFAERAARQGVVLTLAAPAGESFAAEVDVELFERAVANVLDNALKFTPAGRGIVLALARREGGVCVSVADQGSGITPEDLPHLFDRLYRSATNVEPASSDEGRGLGLAIVKRICELHGGSVAVSSVPGQGTRVEMLWPGA
jgi:signal transduction histidine kinase